MLYGKLLVFTTTQDTAKDDNVCLSGVLFMCVSEGDQNAHLLSHLMALLLMASVVIEGVSGSIGKRLEEGLSGVSHLFWQKMFCLVMHMHQHITITMQTHVLQITVLGNSKLEYSMKRVHFCRKRH